MSAPEHFFFLHIFVLLPLEQVPFKRQQNLFPYEGSAAMFVSLAVAVGSPLHVHKAGVSPGFQLVFLVHYQTDTPVHKNPSQHVRCAETRVSRVETLNSASFYRGRPRIRI